MTAPTPEQIRTLAGDFYPKPDPKPPRWWLLSEVDRLRLQRDNSDRRATASVEAMQETMTVISRLRTVIENAPHAEWCKGDQMWLGEDGLEHECTCTCWKADAL
jgi:hypothetical protein